jgi:hypothetical protein
VTVFGNTPSQNATEALVLSILTAVCAALVATAADAPSGVRLLLLIVGAAIPPLVLHVGPRQGVRTVVAIAITGVALFVAYGGFAIFAFASHRPSALPLPPSLPDPSDGQPTTTTRTTTTTPSGPDIEVTPETVHCDVSGCDHTVTITSTGDEVLTIATIEFDPNSAEFAQHGTCEGHDLIKGDQCEVDVTFVPSGAAGTHYAQMVIHQNLPGKPTYVALEGRVDGQPKTAALEFDLDLVGSVPFADRYKADVSIDGTSYTHGFCGFDASTRCVAGKLYTWRLPSMRVGANLSWQFTRISLSTGGIAQGASTLAHATTIAVRCIYSQTTGKPDCMRTK